MSEMGRYPDPLRERDYHPPRDCKHGRLARSCEICELEKEVERLSGEREHYKELADEYRRACKIHMAEVERLNELARDRWMLLANIVRVANKHGYSLEQVLGTALVTSIRAALEGAR